MRSYPKNRARNAAPAKGRALKLLTVRVRPGFPTQGLLSWGGKVSRCALGRGGIRAIKREGDGATPLGKMRLLHGYYRPDRTTRRAGLLPLSPIGMRDGWCDAPGDRNYNRPVTLPYPASAERMRRDDRLYDWCVVLDYNLRPRRRGAGSAIFLHIAKEGYRPTEGCVAVSPATMARLLPRVSKRTRLVVTR